MVRQLIRVTLSLVVFLGLLITASVVVGSTLDTRVAVALVAPTPQGTGTPDVSVDRVAYFDLNRFLRSNYRIPLDNVQQIAFDSYDHVLVSTYSRDVLQNQYHAGLYRYNVLSGQLTNIDSFESDHPSFSANGIYYDYFPTQSTDGRIAFINPTDRKIHVYDLATDKVAILDGLQLDDEGLPRDLSWSPDSTQLSLAQYQTLLMINSDGSNPRRIPFETNQFRPIWSPQGQYILPQQFSGFGFAPVDGPPVQLIKAADGAEVEKLKGLTGTLSPIWGCDDQWFGYQETAPVGITQPSNAYLINIDTDQRIRLNDSAPLENVDIESMIALQNTQCDKFLVTGTPSTRRVQRASTSNPFMRDLYLFDRTTTSATLLTDQAVIKTWEDATLYYEKRSPKSSTLQMFSQVLEPLGEPVLIGEYAPIQTSWMMWDTDIDSALYLAQTHPNLFGGKLTLFDLQNERTYPLTYDDEYVENFFQFDWFETRRSAPS
jgi:hypothetical protein